MSFPRRSVTGSVAVAVVLSLLAALFVLPATTAIAAAQEAEPTLRIRKGNQLVHRSVLKFESTGLPADDDFLLVQCSSSAMTDCVNLGAGVTSADGQVRSNIEVRRELFVGDERGDCAVLDCVVAYTDSDNEFVLDIGFLNDYPMATMEVTGRTNVEPGDLLIASANGYRPSDRPVDNAITLCPEVDDAWEACTDVATIAPSGMVEFTVPQVLDTLASPYDCAAAGNGCYLRIGTYEARWGVTFAGAEPVDESLDWGKRRNLLDGEAVQVEVTSSASQLKVTQCVKPQGERRTCSNAETVSTNVSSASSSITQTLTIAVRRYMYQNGQRFDCANDETVRCDLQVLNSDGEKIGKLARIRFLLNGSSPEASINVPRKAVEVGNKVRVTLKNMPQAAKYVVWQCVADTNKCEKLHTGRLGRANVRKRVAVVDSVDGVDCGKKRGTCSIVVTTKRPATVRLEAPVKIG